MYGLYENVCVQCREPFSPIEGNETREFCSWRCEDEYGADVAADMQEGYYEAYGTFPSDVAAEVYQEDTGRNAPWLTT